MYENEVDPAEITPEHVYRNRRQIMRLGLGFGLAGGAAALAACGDGAGGIASLEGGTQTNASGSAQEETPTTYEAITNYNNYYEFTTDKEGVARLAKDFKT